VRHLAAIIKHYFVTNALQPVRWRIAIAGTVLVLEIEVSEASECVRMRPGRGPSIHMKLALCNGFPERCQAAPAAPGCDAVAAV
jgi:hypothetical protein